MVRVWLMSFMVLAACVQGQRGMSLLQGDVQVSPPAQYCLHRQSARQSAGRAVVLIGKCSAASAVPAALITVSFGEKGSALALLDGPAILQRHLQSPAGRASLARDGRAASVKLGQFSASADQLVFHVQDRSAAGHWRGVLAIKGRMVLVAVNAPQGGSLSSQEGRRLLDQMLMRLRATN